MRMLDLFCGRFGWSRAFAARGWKCVGIDLVEPPEVPENCIFLKADILDLHDIATTGYGPFGFVCASSPCDEFSKFGMKHFFPDPPYPALGLKLFNHTRLLCEDSGIPYVMENVGAARKFVGNSEGHAGPFHLWGSAVPPLVPKGLTKGFGAQGWELNGKRTITPWRKYGSKDVKHRAELKAIYATIPPELANCVADYAESLLRQREVA